MCLGYMNQLWVRPDGLWCSSWSWSHTLMTGSWCAVYCTALVYSFLFFLSFGVTITLRVKSSSWVMRELGRHPWYKGTWSTLRHMSVYSTWCVCWACSPDTRRCCPYIGHCVGCVCLVLISCLCVITTLSAFKVHTGMYSYMVRVSPADIVAAICRGRLHYCHTWSVLVVTVVSTWVTSQVLSLSHS